MKKLICVILSLLMITATFAACDSGKSDGSYKVAIVLQMDHPSLEEISDAVQAELDLIATEKGIQIEYKEYNGQNDTSVLSQIGAQVIAGGYDVIIPIATTAATSMVTAADGYDIPIIYAAISDPESAGLTGLANVTGTSDALNTKFILDMMREVNADVKTVGLLYSKSEINSVTPIAQAKEYLDELGIAYIEKTGNTPDEIIAAASALVGKVDAVFTPTDNAVMAAEAAVAEILNGAGIPHYAGADSFVAAGAFATCGVNYTELGAKTAQMAVSVLQTGEFPAFQLMDGGIITVNTETAAKLNLDYSVFAEIANTLVEVVTG